LADDLELYAVPGGTRLRLRVKPGAKRDAILGVHGGALKVAVAAPPEKGKANRAVVRLLAGALGLPREAVSVVAGESSQDKVVVVGMEPPGVRERLTPGFPSLD
jgi:uncharacterized protein (TIGR00251 family)